MSLHEATVTSIKKIKIKADKVWGQKTPPTFTIGYKDSALLLKAAQSVDDAIAGNNVAAGRTAMASFKTVAKAYSGKLSKSLVGQPGPTVLDMANKIEKIRVEMVADAKTIAAPLLGASSSEDEDKDDGDTASTNSDNTDISNQAATNANTPSPVNNANVGNPQAQPVAPRGNVTIGGTRGLTPPPRPATQTPPNTGATNSPPVVNRGNVTIGGTRGLTPPPRPATQTPPNTGATNSPPVVNRGNVTIGGTRGVNPQPPVNNANVGNPQAQPVAANGVNLQPANNNAAPPRPPVQVPALSPTSTVDPAILKEYLEHVATRERCITLVTTFRGKADTAVGAMSNALSATGLAQNRRLLAEIDAFENHMVTADPDWIPARGSFKKRSLAQAIDPDGIVARLDKQASSLFEQGMRLNAAALLARSKLELMVEQQQLEVEKGESKNLGPDERLARVRNLANEVDLYKNSLDKPLNKTMKAEWNRSSDFTKQNVPKFIYDTRVAESDEAFAKVADASVRVATLRQRLLFVLQGANTEAATVGTPLPAILNTIETEATNRNGMKAEFDKMRATCDKIWQKRGA